MKAVFKATLKEAVAHADIAGVTMRSDIIAKGENLDAYTWNDMVCVAGDAHSVMRLIGAFADDGMDCLLSVSK
jgi:hypothetical protein